MGMTQSIYQTSNMTPMLRQYFDLKGACSDSVLFFRMGDFYEVFGEDAVEVSKVLNIVLTKRDKGDDSIPFCGVPHHSARNYWLKLLKLNFKIAIADQVEEASQAKGLVKRELTKFLTPACIDDLEGLQSDSPNYLMFVYQEPESKTWVIGLADVSTGELKIGEVENIEAVVKAIETYRPKEVLLRRFLTPILKEKLDHYLAQETLLFTAMPEAILRDAKSQKDIVSKVLGPVDTLQVPIPSRSSAVAVLASLFTHLKDLKFSLDPFLSVSALFESERATLNSAAINDLEIFNTVRQNQQKGSLFYEINHCLTPMGARLLRWSLVHPLQNKAHIEKIHGSVLAIIGLGEKNIEILRAHLKGISDIERLNVKLVSKNIKPKELSSIRESLSKIQEILEFFRQNSKLYFDGVIEDFVISKDLNNLLSNALKTEVGGLGSGDEIFIQGFDKILDEKNELSKNGEQKVEEYQERLKKKTGIQSLKIKHHKNFGLLVEITKTHLSKVPEELIRRQTMVNCERFVTIELQELSDALMSAKEDAIDREAILYDSFLTEFGRNFGILKKISASLALFDMYTAFAWVAIQKKYSKPEIVTDSIELKSVRHPTVESFIGSHAFNPNDIFMNEKCKQILITGPNMGGKSTIMRTVAICALLNQSGSFVPALSAKLPVFDQIFTRVGASDDLVKGLSTFMVEMTETAGILRQATKNSLVIFDEVGRGTSTEDGLAIASAVLENLATKILSWTFFATHYHELVNFSKSFQIVRTYQTEVIKRNDGIKFTHRLIEGASGSSYGIQVAKLAGIPENVIKRAHELLDSMSPKNLKISEPAIREKTQAKFSKISSLLDDISINEITPIQAFHILSKLKDEHEVKAPKNPFPDGQSLF